MVLVVAAVTIICTEQRVHASELRVGITNESELWSPLSKAHVDSFFKRPPFSVDLHLEAYQDHLRQRTLTTQVARRLSGDCVLEMNQLSTDFKTNIQGKMESLGSLVQAADEVKIRAIIKELPNVGTAIRQFDFAALGRVVVGGLVGVEFIVEVVSLVGDVTAMMEKAREVITTIRMVGEIVRAIGNNILDMAERTNFNAFINRVRSSADKVLNANVDTSDKLLDVCRGFDYGQISDVSTTMVSYQLCTREKDSQSLTRCLLSVGIAAVSTLVELLAAAAFCDAHVAISQSHSAHPLTSLKADVEDFILSLMASALPPGAEVTDPEMYALANQYSQQISAAASAPAPVNDGDSYVRDALADLHSRTFTSISDVDKYTASDLYRNMTAMNPDAGAAGKLVGLATAKSRDEVASKLTALQTDVEVKHGERMVLYDKVNNTLWTNHGAFMGQVDHMSTLFTEQHTERIGRLKGIEGNLGNIQSSTTNGFATLRGRIQDMGRKFVSEVQNIERNVVSSGAETTSYLSNAVVDANRQIERRIDGVANAVIRNHGMIMSAIGDAQDTAVKEYTASQNVLYSASDSLRQTIDNGLGALADATSHAFNKINDVVHKRMEESHSIMDQLLSGMSSDFALVDDKLVILNNRAASMSNQMEVAKEFLIEIHLRFDQVQRMLDDLPTVIQQEMFQADIDGMHRKYQNMRKVYRDYLDSDLPIKTLAESCMSFQVYDLFLRFVRIVDVSDQELPRQLEMFDYDGMRYEKFVITVVGVLNDLSFLDGVCARAQFSATLKDLEEKAKEQADMILAATSRLAHHVEEVIPALVLENRVRKRIAQVSALAWDVEGMQTVEKLRAEFQSGMNGFASVTVIHAGKAGQLVIDHLDRNTGDGLPRKSGLIVSEDQKLAVIWSQTKRISVAKMATANQTELLYQGVYRGNISSTSQSCFLASSSDDFYPSCARCSCLHYENFASESDPMAGRAVTYLTEKTYDADFVVETVTTSGANFLLQVVQLNMGSLTPGTVATAQLQAPVVTPSVKQYMTLWEGTSGIGRFDVVPSEIKGTLLLANELTLSVTHGSKQMRRTFALFCDGYSKQISVPQLDLQLRYACSEVPHRSTSADVATQGYQYVSPGLPIKRLARAVCSESGKRKVCKVAGAIDAVAANASFTFGHEVSEVTMFTDHGLRGPFVICRECLPETLERYASEYGVQTVYIGMPDVPAAMMQVQCREYPEMAPEKVLVCRPASG